MLTVGWCTCTLCWWGCVTFVLSNAQDRCVLRETVGLSYHSHWPTVSLPLDKVLTTSCSRPPLVWSLARWWGEERGCLSWSSPCSERGRSPIEPPCSTAPQTPLPACVCPKWKNSETMNLHSYANAEVCMSCLLKLCVLNFSFVYI